MLATLIGALRAGRTGLAAFALAAATLAAPIPASAGSSSGGVGFSLHIGGPVGWNPGHRRARGYHRHGLHLLPDRHYRGHRHYRGRCNVRRAIRKAYRLGVDRPRVVRRNRHRVVVRGRIDGYRARVVFANRRRCPLIVIR